MPLTDAHVWRVIADPRVSDDGSRVSVLLATPESAKKDREGNIVKNNDGKTIYPESLMIEAVCWKREDRANYAYDSLKALKAKDSNGRQTSVVITGRISDNSFYRDSEGNFTDTSKMPTSEIVEKVKAKQLSKEVRIQLSPIIVWGTLQDLRENETQTSGDNAKVEEDIPEFLKHQ